MTRGEREIETAHESIEELSVLVAELTVHTKSLKSEIARLIEVISEDREQRKPT